MILKIRGLRINLSFAKKLRLAQKGRVAIRSSRIWQNGAQPSQRVNHSGLGLAPLLLVEVREKTNIFYNLLNILECKRFGYHTVLTKIEHAVELANLSLVRHDNQ